MSEDSARVEEHQWFLKFLRGEVTPDPASGPFTKEAVGALTAFELRIRQDEHRETKAKMHDGLQAALNERKAAYDERDALRTQLAAREAEVVGLRGALETMSEDMLGMTSAVAMERRKMMRTALAAPTGTEALREFGAACIERHASKRDTETKAEAVDAVIRGTP